MFLSESLFTDLVAIIASLVAVVIAYYKWQFTYWKRRNVPFLEPSIPFGNLQNTITTKNTIGVMIQNYYNEMRAAGHKHGGMYLLARATYMPIHLDYVKNILTKDFQYFVDRGVYHNEENEPLSAHLFAIGGEKWRNLRVKLTPTFTSGKMKMMFQTLIDCEGNMLERLAELNEKREPVDIKDLVGCFTTDIIGSCAFGLECNTFKDTDSLFRNYGKKIFVTNTLQRLKITIAQNFPTFAKTLKIKLLAQDTSDFFYKVVKDTVEYREKNNVSRKDFMQLLIDLKNNKLAEEEGYKHDGKTLTLNEIAAQSLIFFLAGFETSSTTSSWALYELAQNQEIQDRVRDEIKRVLAKHDGKVTYEAIQEMKYMDQVLDETLRKYPPVPFITRECVKDYKLSEENLLVEKGTRVLVSILGIQHDAEYYPDPEKFDPERFNHENSQNRHQYAHIPFGEGPRICIGMRFGLMQTKVGLTALLKNYKFTINKKTKQPMQFAVNSFILAADGDIWLDAEKL